MRYCQVGCDLDGVLADGFTPPEADFTAISGRNIDDCERTISQIGATRPIYLKPPDFPGNSGVWKATMIRLLGITKFYEDMAGSGIADPAHLPGVRGDDGQGRQDRGEARLSHDHRLPRQSRSGWPV